VFFEVRDIKSDGICGFPAVFEPNCRTPRQMQLANAFCRYLELASAI
jgi:uncharacterized protein